MSELQEKVLQKGKYKNFFLLLWVIFALLDPDTDSGTPVNPDPDPQNWVQVPV
jgi:hypothetical protein